MFKLKSISLVAAVLLLTVLETVSFSIVPPPPTRQLSESVPPIPAPQKFSEEVPPPPSGRNVESL
ncbi:hypothetical protein HOM50_02685 [bacterium]|mgnify:CR=1 FL=1|jgi:hypothetical protein|nr:hypothetical protein [bacterium]MBT5015287.1 hypothetical protein [bacterium]